MAPLPVSTKPCELDLLSLGALVNRLDPGQVPFRAARSLEVHVSGGEYNVAANLASCFGLSTGIATAMVDNGVGELIERQVRERGVRPFYKRFEHDGVRGPNMATVYSDRGHGVRPPVVFYNRANEAAALLKPGDIDWKQVFAGGCRWFHSGGIFAAIGPHTADLIVEGMQAAKQAGAITSFDLNYRAKLWKTLNPAGGADAEAHGRELMKKIVANTDVLVGNEEDLQKGLGLEGQNVESKSKLDPEAFFGMIESVRKAYPNIRAVATTLREVKSTNRHSWAAVLWIDGERHVSPTMELDVVCRIGGGDGFASGLIYGLIKGKPAEDALRLGWAHGALLTTFTGDVSQATLSEVEALASGGSARVQR
ncbi:2-dehydro-3-deoxygluconokinase [Pirellulimonas nuda]|uniref:2-dehydro-3-deoxygluconokinase n=1 Tax=Pirellulimonas nuda TaxID=2528009 RepID=A0A518DIR8_9BACT|nr:sugar kinase [Pirellulimonas nuda]QDU91356.1 2-dehydro-3-deoxygluconokinase [Pirellulimonas nuda]